MIGKLLVLLVTIAAVTAKVQVSIYYESLCQDSKDFFTKQFTPTWRELKDYMDVELVPFGKSNSTDYNDPTQFRTSIANANSANFTCHHGPNECLGNKYQACALNRQYNYKLEDQINYIDCLMREGQISIPYDQTANKCQYTANAISVQNLKYCVDGTTSKELLLEYERRTNQLVKPIPSVPTVVFNNRPYVRAESDEAVKSFRGALCKHITDSPKPKACEGSGAPATTAGLITLLTAGLVIRML